MLTLIIAQGIIFPEDQDFEHQHAVESGTSAARGLTRSGDLEIKVMVQGRAQHLSVQAGVQQIQDGDFQGGFGFRLLAGEKPSRGTVTAAF